MHMEARPCLKKSPHSRASYSVGGAISATASVSISSGGSVTNSAGVSAGGWLIPFVSLEAEFGRTTEKYNWKISCQRVQRRIK